MSIDAIDRLQRIEARVQSEGRVKVVELAVAFDVSEMTIRRDLDMLAEQGVVQRIRGGAVAIGPQPFAERFSRHVTGQGPDRVQARPAGRRRRRDRDRRLDHAPAPVRPPG